MWTHLLKNHGQSMCFRSVQNKMQQTYFLKKVKACHDYQKSVQGKERPENESPENMIVSRWTTYSLWNGSLEENWVRNFIVTYPLKICYQHTETFWIDYILPSGFINKNISHIGGRINSWCLLPESNVQLMIRCDTLCKIIAHKLMMPIRIYENLKTFSHIHSARRKKWEW